MEYPVLYAQIDLAAVANNVRELKRATAPGARFMAVVKADAYGHGAVPVAKAALENGADALGVARLGEAAELREAGIDAPVLIFGYTPAEAAGRLAGLDTAQTLFSLDGARALSGAAAADGVTVRSHLKIDTGMGRLGIRPGDKGSIRDVLEIAALPGILLEGVYTHFASSDAADKTDALGQFREFTRFLDALEKEGVAFPVRHAANSAAIIEMPETHLDMVRAGISLYGFYPSPEIDAGRVRLAPAMALKSQVAQVKPVAPGVSVSYGGTWTAAKPTVIATVPVGYADGYSRLLSNRGEMLVHGKRAPIAGRVCMDQTMLDVGHIPGVAPGDEVVVFGRQGEETIRAEEVADLAGTIHYEIVSSITKRVPRRYIGP